MRTHTFVFQANKQVVSCIIIGTMKIKIIIFSGLFCLSSLGALSQNSMSLADFRNLALQNNKSYNAEKLKGVVAEENRKAMRTNYLPKVDAVGSYQYFSKEASLLSDEQKSSLKNLGSNVGVGLGQVISTLAQQGVITPEVAQQMGGIFSTLGKPLSDVGNAIGSQIVDALRTDTRQMWAGSVMLRQPVYMGGAIIAANKVADLQEKMVANKVALSRQNILYDVEKTYWLVVSLKQKLKLAESYRDLVKKLDDDVYKMIGQGVATRADGLRVDVKVNEADMQITQIDNGLSLSRMLLMQLCGLPLDTAVVLADENAEILSVAIDGSRVHEQFSFDNRPEVNLLQNMVEVSRHNTTLVRSLYLPHVALTGGYLVSNPNVFNGFERKFSGMWNVGITASVPVWNWFEGRHKVNAAKAMTAIAGLELDEVKEKIDLQVAQERFKVSEAKKRLEAARKNISSAEENLRCADIGFKEGVMEATDVMEAQTAWQKALSQRIDAEIDVKLSQVALEKAMGVLE